MNQTFFNSNTYFIDEKVNLFKFVNEYKVYDEHGEKLGGIYQKLKIWEKLLRLVLNKAMLPFRLEIRNNDNEVQSIIRRGWTFWLNKVTICDSYDVPIGHFKQKFKLFKPTFHILDELNEPIGTISGDWKAWNFSVSDSNGTQIGIITKKWNGAVKELFTTADKYNVQLFSNYNDPKNKIILLSAAISIDMILKESK